jgi:mannose-1-phosphate guanylyltransferase
MKTDVNSPSHRGKLWAIVLAVGDRARLSPLMRAWHERDLPKQFASWWGDGMFLKRTLDRISKMIPTQRTLVVVADQCRVFAEEHLRGYPDVEIVFQPDNRGTGADLLLPLAHVLAHDPQARVVVFPSDQHVEHEAPFQAAIRRAIVAADFSPRGVALIGAVAESAAIEVDWIDCEDSVGASGLHAREVRRFVEKPGEDIALDLLHRGALWNTMILAARGRTLWAMADRGIPEVCWLFMTYRALVGHRSADGFLRDFYSRLPFTDLNRDIFRGAAGLGVISMLHAGWSMTP